LAILNISRRHLGLRGSARSLLAAGALSLFAANLALGYVGESFLLIPGFSGDWPGAKYKNWIKVDANYWPKGRAIGLGGAAGGFRHPDQFSGPVSPRQGAGTLVIAIDKNSRVLPELMEKCLRKTAMSELVYSESSDRARTTFEIGGRPAAIPEYYEYKLKDAQFSDCPSVPDAPQQAIVVSFKDIERLNYQFKDDGIEAKFDPPTLRPAPPGRTTKSFVLTWIAPAQDVSDDQCPVLNSKPTEVDYYRYVSPQAADQERAELASKGGVNYENGQMGLRGPGKLNVTMAPGVVPDPGNAEPQTKFARGLDLDGDDGTGKPPAGICKHKNYASPDGRAGIDNQLYRVEGCIASFQGHKGFIMQFANNQMHDGLQSILVQITGMDNETNDKSVDVSLFYSLDPMAKSATGGQILSDFTFRVTDKPQYTHYFARLHGRIVNGVLITDPVKQLRMNLSIYGTPVHLNMWHAGLRLELTKDGNLKGILGGYQDWRVIASRYASSAAEQVHNFQVPGLYNALKRAADGMKDPVTGQCDGISSAYDLEGVPAFIETAPSGASERRDVARVDTRGQ
jgi:hypothetical protein